MGRGFSPTEGGEPLVKGELCPTQVDQGGFCQGGLCSVLGETKLDFTRYRIGEEKSAGEIILKKEKI